MNLHEKLKGIQHDCVAAKDAFNSFGNYNYRSCESILKALKPHLEQSNLVLTLSDDVIAVGERVYIKATAILSDGEVSVSTTAFAREPLSKKGADESQVTGMASSYARKYALCGLFAIDDNKDADATNTHGAQQPKPRQQSAQQLATAEQVDTINRYAAMGKPQFDYVKGILHKNGVQSNNQLPLAAAQQLCTSIINAQNKQASQ